MLKEINFGDTKQGASICKTLGGSKQKLSQILLKDLESYVVV